jgi:hypothetical protein
MNRFSRRDFLMTSLVGAAGLCLGGAASRALAADVQAQLSDEDGYKLWLRFVPPGAAAESYRRSVRQIRVDGTSATCGIIRDELHCTYQGCGYGKDTSANYVP